MMEYYAYDSLSTGLSGFDRVAELQHVKIEKEVLPCNQFNTSTFDSNSSNHSMEAHAVKLDGMERVCFGNVNATTVNKANSHFGSHVVKIKNEVLEYDTHKDGTHVAETAPTKRHTDTNPTSINLLKNELLIGNNGHSPFPKKISCTNCDERFCTLSELSVHTCPSYECMYCAKEFRTSRHLERHLPIHTKLDLYACPECGRGFRHQINLTRHRKIHLVEYKCTDCSKVFQSCAQLKRHLKTHTRTRTYECTDCGNVYSSRNTLHVHTRTHLGTRPYKTSDRSKGAIIGNKDMHTATNAENKATESEVFKCDGNKCNESFTSRYKLSVHRRTHAGMGFKCSDCTEEFETYHKLSIHRRLHTGDTPYPCTYQYCNQMFITKARLAIHVKTTHRGEKLHECSECPVKFATRYKLNIHMRSHTGAPDPHKCPRCVKRFPTRYKLEIHSRKHTGETPYVCSYCSKDCQTAYKLTVHIRTHTGEKPHVCNQCGQELTTASNLISHLKRHATTDVYPCTNRSNTLPIEGNLELRRSYRSDTPNAHMITRTGSRQLKCNVCTKRFVTVRCLQIHTRSHTGEKPYKCTHCAKNFTTKSACVFHTISHATRKPYECGECNRQFTIKICYENHMKEHSDTKPFVCTHCGKRFVVEDMLVVHMETHVKTIRTICNTSGIMDDSSHVNIPTVGIPLEGSGGGCTQCGERFVKSEETNKATTGTPLLCVTCADKFKALFDLDV